MRKIIFLAMLMLLTPTAAFCEDAVSLTDAEVWQLMRQTTSPDAENHDEACRKLTEYFIANTSKITPQNADFLHTIMQKTMKQDPDDAELKEKIAKVYIVMRRYQQAAELYEQLVRRNPNRPELLYAQAENLIAANQLNDAGVALAMLVDKHCFYIPGHLLYASYMEKILGRQDDAEEIINNMVDSNLQNAASFARRSIYRLEHRNEKGAVEDLKEAMKIDEKNADTIIAAATYAIKTRDFRQARQYLDAVREEDKDNDDISNLRIRLADAENRPEDAITELTKRLERRDVFILRIQLFDRLVATRRLDEARAQIDHMKTMKMSMEMIGFFESAIDIVEDNWRIAARKLELSRSIFSAHPETVAFVDRQLALCYGKMGQTDKQLDAFQRAIENTPQQDILPISIAYILALNTAGRTQQLEEAINDLIAVIGEKTFMEIPQLRSIRIAMEIQKTSNLPAGEQDWNKVKAMVEGTGIEKNSPEGVLLSVRLLLKQEKDDDARALLKQAIADNPDFTGFVSYLALMEAQLKNYEEALRILDEQIAKRGPLPALLIIKTRVLAQMPSEKAAELLRKMEEGVQGLESQTQKVVLLKQVAPAWQAVGKDAEAKRVFETLVELEPENVGTRIHLFDLARKMSDEPEMTERMKQVRELAGKDSPEDIYCRVARETYRSLVDKSTEKKLENARKLLDKAKAKRSNWPNIPRLQAEIALVQKDYPKAIECLYEVDRLGALTTQQLELLIKLLYNEKREDEIPALLEGREGAVDDIKAVMDVPGNSPLGDAEAVLKSTRIAGDFLWRGNLALRNEEYPEALEAFKKVVELAPENTTGWVALIQTMKLMGKDTDELLAAKAEMEKALPADKLPLANAKILQLFGEAEAAEKAFLEALEKEPENLEVHYSISSFYLRTTRPELARPHLEKMLLLVEKAEDIDERLKTQQLEWVRKSLAELDELEKKKEKE